MPRLLTQPPPADPAGREIRIFARVRNEAVRLAQFLAHYRALGVDRFLIVDNGSTDGTADLLAAEADVHLFSAEGSYRAAGQGQAWLDCLLNEHGCGRWCVVVDADELLVYPSAEATGLRAFCGALEREAAEALPCMLLDMYAAGPMRAVAYAAGEPFLAACPWFDAAPYWRAGPGPECPYHEIYGGVRQRVFYPRWQQPDLALLLTERLYNLANRLGPIRRNATIQAWRTRRPPNLAKVPLIRWRAGFRYLAGTHKVTPVRLSAASGALLHFKFLGDFREKAGREAQRGEYFDGAREYRRYAAVLAEEPDLSLWHPGSVRFAGTGQLCALGLMRPLPGLQAASQPQLEDALHDG